jgi:hypothetical protein
MTKRKIQICCCATESFEPNAQFLVMTNEQPGKRCLLNTYRQHRQVGSEYVSVSDVKLGDVLYFADCDNNVVQVGEVTSVSIEPPIDLQQIVDAKSPEDIFGSLDGTERPELSSNSIPTRLANLILACAAIHKDLLFHSLEPSEEVIRKLWAMQYLATKKIQAGTYGKKKGIT